MSEERDDRDPSMVEAGLGAAVLRAVDKAVEARWERAKRIAAETEGTRAERIDELRRRFIREASGAGAAVGAAAAAPGAGLFTFAGATAAELGWFTLRASDLIMAVGAVHGRGKATVEERRAWVLSILAYGDTAHDDFSRTAGAVGKGLGQRATANLPTAVLAGANRIMAKTLLTKFGASRTLTAIGRAFPFGIGAVIGGATNYAFARQIADDAERFFAELGR